MKKLLLCATALTALVCAAPASADVTILDQLSGTGDNVTFDSFNGTNLAIGSFNGQHTGFVDFTDLSGNPLFTGAANGNDIKIANTSNLMVQVFDTSLNPLATATDVFSIKGTGDVTAFVTANEAGGGTKLFTFDLGVMSPNAQSGFTLTAINGESINFFTLLDVGGQINDFEHYRIDVAASAVPEPATWAMMLLGFIGLAWAFRSRRRVVGFA